MAKFSWRPFLERFSRELLADVDVQRELPRRVVKSGWLGFAPASERQIQALEKRLNVPLPSSYRTFLATSNGWRDTGPFIWNVWPTSKVAWFCENNQDWIDAYVEPSRGDRSVSDEEYFVYGTLQAPWRFRREYLQTTLQIVAVGDSAVYLLNPKVQTSSGEWEAWFFANWSPGATRYRSFQELMEHALADFICLRDGRTRGSQSLS